jgi:ribulose-phosphate 3-epimerase
MIELAPSILTADFTRLGLQVDELFAEDVKRLHLDIMDGRFVPNISFGPDVVAAVSPLAHAAGAIVEVHLMIVEPERYLEAFRRAGGDLLLVHVETCPHLHRTLQQIGQLGAARGVVLNPATPLAAVEEVLDDVDQVLVMTVNPGFGGQAFIPECLGKVRRLRDILARRGLHEVRIEVDGGVHASTIRAAQDAGAQVAVTGSAVYNSLGSVSQQLRLLRAACEAS